MAALQMITPARPVNFVMIFVTIDVLEHKTFVTFSSIVERFAALLSIIECVCEQNQFQ